MVALYASPAIWFLVRRCSTLQHQAGEGVGSNLETKPLRERRNSFLYTDEQFLRNYDFLYIWLILRHSQERKEPHGI
jgi:hypothetical protein